jgi:hypothetical protein
MEKHPVTGMKVPEKELGQKGTRALSMGPERTLGDWKGSSEILSGSRA